jgi:ABC-type transporter Mla MlaB component
MLHITRTDDRDDLTTLRLAGRLTEFEVPALEEAWDACVAERRRVVLDLAEIQYVDGAGVALLRALRKGPFDVTGCSGFVRELLQEKSS